MATSAASRQQAECIFTLTPEQRNALLSSQHDQPELCTALFRSMREAFEEWGYVLVRGALDDNSLNRLRMAGETMRRRATPSISFAALELAAAFSTEEIAFRETCLRSAIPAVVAKLLLNDAGDGKSEEKDDVSIRVLKDAFFAKGKEEKHCGWHVDDMFFWPTDSSSCGLNVWLALDDIPSKYGGGLAVAPKSHVAEWRRKAYEILGSTPTLPPEGITPSNSVVPTCQMAHLDRDMHDQIESSKVVFDSRPGDCLFCSRWLFHRSVPINEDGLRHYAEGDALKRYSIRYERGDARLIGGMSVEPCVLTNPENSGRTLDEVCAADGPFYPLCWPPLDEREGGKQDAGMDELARGKLPDARVKKMEIMQDIMARARAQKIA